jgi:pilus assembly protein CpaB
MVFRLGIFAVLVIALIAVSVFGISLLNHSKQQQAAAPPPPTAQILVADGLLQAGTLIQPGNLQTGNVPVDAVPAGASLDTPANRSDLIGSMIRLPISPGAPILQTAIIHPGDHGFLAAVLAPGMRAVTVGVDAVSGAAGLIWPGDHVDVLLTQTLDDPTVPLGQRIAAEIVLRDVRVIATGQQLIQGQVSVDGKADAPPPATTVTLEVTPDQAERCEVATHLGPLSLVVQSAQSLPESEAEGTQAQQPVWADQVSPALANTHPQGPVISTVHVFAGDNDDQDFKF